jgi:hypothetical protein
MHVYRVRSPAVLDNPEVRDLVLSGLNYTVFGLGPPGDVLAEIAASIGDPHMGVFLAFTAEGRPAGFGIVQLPTSALLPVPMVSALYSQAGRHYTQALISAGLAFMRANGYIRFWAINSSGHSDAAWKRCFRLPGETGQAATLHEFRIGES